MKFIKKVMLPISLLLFIGCGGSSSSDNNNTKDLQNGVINNNGDNSGDKSNSNNVVSNKLTPPKWIQATWMDRSEPLLPTGFLFTSDDMYSIVGDNSSSIFSAGIPKEDTLTQVITDKLYSFTIYHKKFKSTEKFTFHKLSDTQIQFEDISGNRFAPLTREN